MTKPLKPNTFCQPREDLEQVIPAEGPGQTGEEELEAVKAVLDDGTFTLGPFVKRFEEEFEEFLGVKYAHTTNACTTAMEIAAKLIGIGPGDDVICPSISFVATSLPLRTLGANVIFPDVVPDTLNMDPEDLGRRITPKTKAIFVVHEDGHPVDMDRVMEIAGDVGAKVVEDCAHALGVKYKGRTVGTIGDFGCFSFHAKKMVTTLGEGGMLVTNDDGYGAQVGIIRTFGWAEVAPYTDPMTGRTATGDNITINGYAGTSYPMTDAQAAVGSVQLRRLPQTIAVHRHIAALYDEALAAIDGFGPPVIADYAENNYFRYRASFDPDAAGVDRYELADWCAEQGVHCGEQFVRPLYTFRLWREAGHDWGECPVLERQANRTFYLPVYAGLEDRHVRRVVDTLKAGICKLKGRAA
ncbi:MAG: DegT/DnrJ/EryC1/StrS family aminotransferase [Lentisphaeria bacterium]|jgi:perosamine synthetase|nr:DegT/DnrJ/EryC1/StrS family aminotransferase [Lentisphaeria bacterium]MDP7741450.1 DegT/DnrJ/EryC1/StrS family aminotransferase [Lentisphaeria bacterium]